MAASSKFLTKRRKIIFGIGLAVAALAFWLWPKLYWAITVDSCLDMGGRWNYQTRECEGVEDQGLPSGN